MRLYASKIDTIAGELLTTLLQDGDVEVTSRPEAELDLASVLKEYLRVDRELTERAKDILQIRGLPGSAFTRTKKTLADQKEFGLGEEGLTWICNQFIETFMHSPHIDEIYADDVTLRRKAKEVLRKHMAVDDELDQEVRKRIRNLEEGSSAWDVEYARVMDQIKQKHGLS